MLVDREKVGIGLSLPALGEMVRFGLPLVFSNLGLFTLNFSDRFFLQHFHSVATVGVYAVGYKFGYMISFLLVQPFYGMWQVRMYAVHDRPDHPRIFGEMFMLYCLLLIYAALGLSLVSEWVVALMVDPRFAGSGVVIPVVALAYVFSGIGYYVQVGMFVAKRTSLVGSSQRRSGHAESGAELYVDPLVWHARCCMGNIAEFYCYRRGKLLVLPARVPASTRSRACVRRTRDCTVVVWRARGMDTRVVRWGDRVEDCAADEFPRSGVENGGPFHFRKGGAAFDV